VINIIQTYDMSVYSWLLLALCSILLGMTKTGLSGAGLIVIPLMAGIFGGKESVGIVLPMLIVADIFAVKYYNRHANWKYNGFSDHSVPSLSNVAIRSAGGTKSGEPGVVTFFTKVMIDSFALPSFQDGRGSVVLAQAGPHQRSTNTSAQMQG
jgi:hypothetical protein